MAREDARKKARSDLHAPLSEFTVEDRGSYGCVLQHRGSHRKIFSSSFPPRSLSRHAPTAADLLRPFILPFLSSLSTHERFTSRVKDTRPPVLCRDRSSGHDAALHTEFLDPCASIPIRRGSGILMTLRYYRRKHELRGTLVSLARNTCDKLKSVCVDILSRTKLPRVVFINVYQLFSKYISFC